MSTRLLCFFDIFKVYYLIKLNLLLVLMATFNYFTIYVHY